MGWFPLRPSARAQVLEREYVDVWYKSNDKDSFAMARRLITVANKQTNKRAVRRPNPWLGRYIWYRYIWYRYISHHLLPVSCPGSGKSLESIVIGNAASALKS